MAGRYGITFNGKHSFDDFGITVATKVIGNPEKIKRKERVPYSNEIYDFSKLYGGGQEYEERPLTYVFNIRARTKEEIVIKKIEFLNHLQRPIGKVELRDDVIPGYYFMAEVEEAPQFNELSYGGTLAVTFTAYPFKIADLREGHDKWDAFNFLLDSSPIVEYEVYGSVLAILQNPGASSICPTIKSTSPMIIVMADIEYRVPVGESKSYSLPLKQGANYMQIIGNGIISFEFNKEVL
ncbi:phage tail protein [Bacillus cereus]|uniref:Phage tail protein n=1 Tax=Bacillus cereus TaxID=1396 RepID=A0A9X9ABM5_BACCE|nr:phage tail protein [Bacillus cereus]